MKKFKSLTIPIKGKVVCSYSHYKAIDKDETYDIGKGKGENLLILASFVNMENRPFLIVYDEAKCETYNLHASFIENAIDFYDHPESIKELN